MNIFECYMLRHMTVLFPDGSGYFQQDNAPCHKSRKTLGWLAQKNVNVLDWLPSSPDLNPIENLWSIVKKEYRQFHAIQRLLWYIEKFANGMIV